MEKLRSQRGILSLLLFLQFSSLNLLLSSAQDKYFINCGSHTNATIDDRIFVLDTKSDSSFFSISANGDETVKDDNPSPDSSTLYQTARIFTRQSSYKFHINNNGTHLVRLHFFSFHTPKFNLTSALFNVSIPGFFLLTNFTLQNNNDNSTSTNTSTPEVREFLLNIDIGEFVIDFTPSQETSLAFVNAIEVFSAPEDLIPSVSPPHITLTGSNENYGKGLLAQPLETIYRINVGGYMIKPSEDSPGMWRSWIPDNNYLYDPEAAKLVEFSGELHYIDGLASRDIAPDNVYRNGQEINKSHMNITWLFHVSRNATHLLRLHFCDIASVASYMLVFNVYINTYYDLELDLSNVTGGQLAVPYYVDFVVDSDDSGIMRISIGPSNKSIPNAILNGLEIMEMKNVSGPFPQQDKPGVNHVVIIVGSVIAGVVVICILIFAFLFVEKCRKRKPVEKRETTTYHGGSSVGTPKKDSVGRNINLDLKFPFAEIQFATNNFDKKFLIGVGGFGKVYKGVLRNNTKVAVKRSERRSGSRSGQGFQEFEAEIMVFSKIRHRHLVSLIGYCEEGPEMILVYEFMEKGTLRDHLYNSDLPCLSWKQRLQICIGSARGLHYLHTGLVQGIIHRDVKTTNILLDENYGAKVADFGLSKARPSVEEAHVITAVKGTFGYFDPEYFRRQHLTDKSDVYSFGVVLLEVLCARPVINQLLPRDEVNLVEWAMKMHKNGLLEQIIDPLLVGQINPNCLRKFWETAEKCLSEYGVDRPNMGDVVWELEYALKLQETGMDREPHEDSTTIEVSEFPFLGIRHVPSINMPFEEEHNIATDDASNSSESQIVFSQLRIDGGR